MPNPNYNSTITIYHKGERSVYKNCFFKCETHIEYGVNSSTYKNTYTARVPYVEGFAATEGDIVVLGAVEDEVTNAKGGTLSEILRKYKPNAFKVTSVADNTRFICPHYRLGG